MIAPLTCLLTLGFTCQPLDAMLSSLNALQLEETRDALVAEGVPCGDREAIYKEFRGGDVRHSHANIDKAVSLLGYAPESTLADGLRLTVAGFVAAGD